LEQVTIEIAKLEKESKDGIDTIVETVEDQECKRPEEVVEDQRCRKHEEVPFSIQPEELQSQLDKFDTYL
jgi:hypothetical protein